MQRPSEQQRVVFAAQLTFVVHTYSNYIGFAVPQRGRPSVVRIYHLKTWKAKKNLFFHIFPLLLLAADCCWWWWRWWWVWCNGIQILPLITINHKTKWREKIYLISYVWMWKKNKTVIAFFFCGKSFPFYYSFVMPTNSEIQFSMRRRNMEVGQQGRQTTPIVAYIPYLPMTLNCQISVNRLHAGNCKEGRWLSAASGAPGSKARATDTSWALWNRI